MLLALLIAVLCLSSSCGLLPTESQPFDIPTGNTLAVFASGPLTLDPAISQEAESHNYLVQIFSGLVALDRDEHDPRTDYPGSL